MKQNINKPGFIYYILAACLYMIVIAWSILYYRNNPLASQGLVTHGRDYFISQYIVLWSSSSVFSFVIVFIRNALISLVTIVGGIIFGIIPIYILYSNANSSGMNNIVTRNFSSLDYTLLSFLTYDFLTLVAFIISAGIGMWLGVRFFRKLFYHENNEFILALKYAWQRYYTIILPLLLVSSIIGVLIKLSIF